MSDNDILTMTKANLQISVDAFDGILLDAIGAAKKYIATEGITLGPDISIGDATLVSGYAVYLFEQRRGSSGAATMPRWLRFALNNRLVQEKAQVLYDG